jgi:hypothetical protein
MTENIYNRIYELQKGRATAEAVSRWLPNAAARVRVRIWQVGFVVDEVASGKVEPLRSPCTKQQKFEIVLPSRSTLPSKESPTDVIFSRWKFSSQLVNK